MDAQSHRSNLDTPDTATNRSARSRAPRSKNAIAATRGGVPKKKERPVKTAVKRTKRPEGKNESQQLVEAMARLSNAQRPSQQTMSIQALTAEWLELMVKSDTTRMTDEDRDQLTTRAIEIEQILLGMKPKNQGEYAAILKVATRLMEMQFIRGEPSSSGDAVILMALRAGATVLQTDTTLLTLWNEYRAHKAAYRAIDARYLPAHEAFFAEFPCPANMLPGDHWKQIAPQWRKRGLARLCREWNAGFDAITATCKTIRATPADGLTGIAVKIAAIPMHADQDDCLEMIAAALADISRLTGMEFAAPERGELDGD